MKKNKLRIGLIQEIILSTIKVVGVLTIAAVAPNIFIAFKKLGKQKTKSKRSINESLRRLIKCGFVTIKIKDGIRCVKLTQKGKNWITLFEKNDYKINKPEIWDKKWRIIIFDIPERRKGLRIKIRRTLSNIGFVRLQDSVWVYPYDCEDFITLLKADFFVGKDILYIVADKIENDYGLKKVFNLS